jgi:hypothetical protein
MNFRKWEVMDTLVQASVFIAILAVSENIWVMLLTAVYGMWISYVNTKGAWK